MQGNNVADGGFGPQAVQFATYAAMKGASRWLLWKEMPNPDPDKKPRKVPYYVNGNTRTKTDTPEDWEQLSSYIAAKSALVQPGNDWGLAFALGPDGSGGHWQGIDFDNVEVNQLSGIANRWLVDLHDWGHVELSPSNLGAHVIGYGRKFPTLGSNATGIEAYAAGRFFTVTEQEMRNASAGQLIDLANYVEQALAPRHALGKTQATINGNAVELVPVDAKTISELRSALNYIKSDDYTLWISIGIALRELGDIGRGLWLDWSQKSDKYKPTDAKKWETFKPSATGYKAVFAKARDAGWLNPASNAAQIGGTTGAQSVLFEFRKPTHKPRHFKLLMDGDLQRLPPLRWLVKRIIPAVGIGAIYGDSGTYKSFLALDMLAHISNGQEWFGKRVKAAPAVYVPFEGQGGIPNRVNAWRLAQTQARLPEGQWAFAPAEDVVSNIAVIMDQLNLREQADRDRLVTTLTERGWAGGVLCIDTLAHASNGIDENSSQMGEMIAIFCDLQQRLGGVILLIHHSGKDAARGMRGWSGLHAAMDFVIECQHEKGKGHRDAQFVLTKVKDGATGGFYSFTMKAMELGVDEDGDSISSLVVVSAAGAEPSAPTSEHDAERDEGDDNFVWHWVKRERERGEYPSGRSLEGQREKQMSQEHAMTQKRLRDAIHRLRAASRLVDAENKAPSGNVFMDAV